MRPEVLESNFYAYRLTGDVKYFNRAAAAVQSIETFLKTPTVAYAPINDVDATDSDFIDDMESFWFARCSSISTLPLMSRTASAWTNVRSFLLWFSHPWQC